MLALTHSLTHSLDDINDKVIPNVWPHKHVTWMKSDSYWSQTYRIIVKTKLSLALFEMAAVRRFAQVFWVYILGF